MKILLLECQIFLIGLFEMKANTCQRTFYKKGELRYNISVQWLQTADKYVERIVKVMKAKKEILFEYMLQQAHKARDPAEKRFTTQELSEQLGMQRSNISKLLNELAEDQRLEKIQGRPVLYRLANLPGTARKEESCFQDLIGRDGSLKHVIQLAKAAILYPAHSLHTLIIGPGGSGKNFFASLMAEFARETGVIGKDAPFVRFNCCHYGGIENEIGIKLDHALHRAMGGVLFIDHIDMLPASPRDQLLELLEDVSDKEATRTILICAVNDNVKKSLLDTYTSKFSVQIDLPPLQSRGMEERFALVQRFFIEESVRMDKIIKVNAELLRCLLLYRCEHHIKQLKSDIKIGCANAYVREFYKETKELYLFINDFPPFVRKGFLYYKDHHDEVESLIPQNYSYTFSGENMECIQAYEKKQPPATERESIYDIIDQKAQKLRQRGISESDIRTIINAELDYDMKQIATQLSQEDVNRESLLKVVDTRILTMVEKFLKEASLQFGRVYPVSIFYGLCLHLSATLERVNTAQRLSNSRIMEIVEGYQEEYAFCMKFSNLIEKEFNVSLSIDEVVFITMFVCDTSLYGQPVSKPVVLIAMHGSSTASSMADMVNSLVKSDNTYAFDMPLDMDMQKAYEELKKTIQEIDRGQGILLLYDMGSLQNMAEMIMKETGIQVKMLEIPGSLIAMDTSRKASCLTSLDELHEQVMDAYKHFYAQMTENYQRQNNHKLIITLCMSGEGGAVQMKSYLEKYLSLGDVDIVPLAINDRTVLLNKINQLRQKQDILYIIGTYDPKLHGIPFISVAKLFETPTDKLDILLALQHSRTPETVDFEAIYAYLSEQLPQLNIALLRRHLPKAIAQIKKCSKGLSLDQELGLFLHISCAIHRIQEKEAMPAVANSDNIICRHKRLYHGLKDILQPLEKSFGICFLDDELSYIISIIKKI